MVKKNEKKRKPRGRPKGSTDKKPRAGHKAFDDFNLDSIDWRMLEIEIKEPEVSHSELSRRLNIDDRQISKRRARLCYQDQLIDSSRTAVQLVKDVQRKAVRKLAAMMNSKNEVIALKAATELAKVTLSELTRHRIDMDVHGDFDKSIEGMTLDELRVYNERGLDAIDEFEKEKATHH